MLQKLVNVLYVYLSVVLFIKVHVVVEELNQQLSLYWHVHTLVGNTS